MAQTDGTIPSEPSAPRGQVIATFYYSNSEQGFDADGHRVDIADYRKMELYLLTEYRVTDDVTLTVTPSLRDVSVEGPDNDSSGLGYTDVGARYRFAHGDGWSLATQGTIRIPGDSRRDVLAQVGSTDTEYDLRLRGIYGFAIGADSGFVDLQGAYRLRDGDPPNEYHVDITAGYRPAPRLLLMAQSFNTFSDGRGEGIFDRYRYHNAQLSAVYEVAPGLSLQAGWVGTLGGKNALRERGAFGGVWVSF
ncbi:transporter [Stakelama sp. CBK3Z-3]|uniref:Transporter n=1 Tax=Stakelama flava TaxID=2860338 RepID=A0ABS6XP49_9SPHN|nr:transporter [Stakelama flava]MBW4331987.1 transporter [Stakelama flava]